MRRPEKDFSILIKSVTDAHELLDILSATRKEDIEPEHLSHALNLLLALQKNGDSSFDPAQLTQHAGFDRICYLLKFKAPRMEANDLIICLKVLSYFRLGNGSLAVKRLLHLIKDRINDLSPMNLLFLNFVLSKNRKTPLTEAICIAIPIVFNINLGLKMDHNNVVELVELFHHISKSSVQISTKSMNSLVVALSLHGDNIAVKEATSLIWSLTSFRNFDPVYEKIFYNCIDILNAKINEMHQDAVESTLTKMISSYMRGNHIFYHEKFYNNCVRYFIDKDAGYLNVSYVLRKLNKINFVSLEMLDYIDTKIVSNYSNLSSANISGLMTLAAGLSNANYKSKSWEIIKSLLHENPMIHSDRIDVPWLKFALDLMSVGFHSNILFEKVFSSDYLDKALNHDMNMFSHIQLLLLWQSVKLLIPDYDGPLPQQKFIDEATVMHRTKSSEGTRKILADVFGGSDYVQSNVLSSHRHCLDHVISFDINEDPVAMPCKINRFDEIPKKQVKSVAVFVHGRGSYPLNFPQRMRGIADLRKRTIHALGIKTVDISVHQLASCPDTERLEFVNREIRYALR